jgi:hypothetical protein
MSPNPLSMYYNTEFNSGLSSQKHDVVEIKLWGLYLLSTPGSLFQEIVESSLDHGPVEKNPQKPGRITFRFSTKAWEGRIKKLLYSNRIPVVVNHSEALSSFTSQRQLVV